MEWIGWVVGVIAVLAAFVLWDVIFCGGKRCRGLIDRL